MSRRTPSARLPARAAAIGTSARAAAIGATLLLAGCHFASSPLVGFGGFIGDTHTFQTNPNRIAGGDENVQYSEGRGVAVQPLLPEPGNIWPGPPAPIPTLTDVEKQQNQQEPAFNQPSNQPAPTKPPAHRPITRGSSTPPGGTPTVQPPPPAPPPAEFNPLPSPAPATPPVINTPNGPLIPNGPGTATAPGGGTSIVVPNGNGTSTVIGPDGSTTTIPTPK